MKFHNSNTQELLSSIDFTFNDMEDFKRINFGKADAYKELSHYPTLIDHGFLDSDGYIDNILNNEHFFVVGNKGSGKSEIACKFLRMEQIQDNIFTNVVDLKDFPYRQFPSFIPNTEVEIKRRENWKFLLLFSLLGSFERDLGCKSSGIYPLMEVIEKLEELGIPPKACVNNRQISEVVKITSRSGFSVKIPTILEGFHSVEKEEQYNQNANRLLLELISECVHTIKTPSKHIIFYDGLDEILNKVEQQLERKFNSISSLIIAANDINDSLRLANVNAKIIVMCRRDLYNKFWDSNINKIFQDSAISLDWFSPDLNNSNLIKLINLRAGLSLGRDVDVIKEFFPTDLGRKESIRMLFEHIRQKPRDIVELMNYLKKHAYFDSKGVLTPTSFWAGISDYSSSYFIEEIKNDLVGFMERSEAEKILQIIEHIGSTKFHLNDVEKRISEDLRFKDINLTESFNALFECGAIGNYNKNNRRYYWKYENPSRKFSPDWFIVVHKGLHYTLNLKWRDLDPKIN